MLPPEPVDEGYSSVGARIRSQLSPFSGVLFAILMLSAVLRIWELDAESLWNDELSSWARTHVGGIDEAIRRISGDVHPPGYFILLNLQIRSFGDSELALRAPSVLAGVLAVFFAALLGRRLYDKATGLAVAALMALSWPALYYSQEARPYAFLLLGSIALVYYWVQLLDELKHNRPLSKTAAVMYLVAAVATAYLHYFGLLLVVLLMGYTFLALCFHGLRALSRWSLLCFLVIAAYLPWIPTMVSQFTSRTSSWIEEPTLLGMLVGYAEFAFPLMQGWQMLLILVPYLVFLTHFCRHFVRRWSKAGWRPEALSEPDLLILLWLIAPFIASYMQSLMSHPVVTMRNLIILLAPSYLILVRGMRLMQPAVFGALWPIAVLLAFSHALLADGGYYSSIKKTQFRETAAFVLQTDGPATPLPIVFYAHNPRYFDYYFKAFDSSNKAVKLAGQTEDVDDLLSFLSAQKANGFWYLSAHLEPEAEFLRYLDSNYRLVEKRDSPGAMARKYLMD